MSAQPGAWLAIGLGVPALSAGLTWLAIAYARYRQLLDQPGRRRSHAVPTPRGGGIAIVACLLLCMPWLAWPQPMLAAAFAVGLVLVAGIGWLDDHRPLSARLRLAVHLLAAALWTAALLASAAPPGLTVAAGLLALPVLVWMTGCINAWNFMDGSNGLVASQCIWLAVMLAIALLGAPEAAQSLAQPWASLALVLAAASLGFLPFNAPRARIFLGDVGSGSLGWACGALLVLAWWFDPGRFWWLLILPSALLVDAALTLAWRILAGRRWYTAHREHLYQWLVRCGHGHARVALWYMGWNLLVVLPCGIAMHARPDAAMPLALVVLGLACGLWRWSRRQLLRTRRRRMSQ